MPRGVKGEKTSPKSCLRQHHSYIVHVVGLEGIVPPMRDFQTWLIMQVMVARGAACQFISELPACPDCTVYTSQAAEQGNKTHLTWPKTSCDYWF